MKYLPFLFIFVIVKGTLISARTIDDVLLDFQPVFEELHTAMGDLQTLSHDKGPEQTDQIRSFISQFTKDTVKVLGSVMDDIRDQMQMILGETGMVGHQDLVKHCFYKEQLDVSALSEKAGTGLNLCNEIGLKVVDKFYKILSELYDKQASWHYALEDIKTSEDKCRNMKTPYEMQTCLIKFLYYVEKPYVEQQAPKDLLNWIKSNDEFVTRVSDDLKVCFSIVSEKSMNDKLPIIDDYKKCVIEAAENVPKQ